MNIIEIINKKAGALPLNKEEIFYFVNNYPSQEITDYQMSALLMAIKINGMNNDEIFYYTEALINSGEHLIINNDFVDKHSTGGIGDKVSLALLPILAAMDLKIFKLSGRGLGFTGGTIDKLESIKNFQVNLTIKAALKQTEKIGLSITSQSPNLVPADGKIYSLRDVSGSVDSIPLIAASVISKKIASGAKNIFIDLKVGSGAFMTNMSEAKKLADTMKIIANRFDRNLFVLISSMNQPLGKMLGNGNEIYETILFLKQEIVLEDYYQILEKIATELYAKTKAVSIIEAKRLFEKVLKDGTAYRKFVEWITYQGANEAAISKQKNYWNPKVKFDVIAEKDGYFQFKDLKQIGYQLVEIGAGRKHKEDKLNYNSGIELYFKQNDFVKKNQKLFTVYNDSKIKTEIIEKLKQSMIVTNKSTKTDELFLGELRW